MAALLLLAACAAPLPPPRGPSRADLCGHWLARWYGEDCRVDLLPDGRYRYQAGAAVYVGRWSLAGRTLEVWEREDDPDSLYMVTRWRLARRRRGYLCTAESRSPLRLLRRVPP